MASYPQAKVIFVVPKPHEFAKIGDIGSTESRNKRKERWQKKSKTEKWLLVKYFRWTMAAIMGRKYLQLFDDWTQGKYCHEYFAHSIRIYLLSL